MNVNLLCTGVYKHELTGEIIRSSDFIWKNVKHLRNNKMPNRNTKNIEFSSLNQSVEIFDYSDLQFDLRDHPEKTNLLGKLNKFSKLVDNSVSLTVNNNIHVRIYSTNILIIKFGINIEIHDKIFSNLCDDKIPENHDVYVHSRIIIELFTNRISKLLYEIYKKNLSKINLPNFDSLYVSRTCIINADLQDDAYWHCLWSEKIKNSKNAKLINSGTAKYCIAWGNSTVFNHPQAQEIRTFELIKDTLQNIYVSLYCLNKKISEQFNSVIQNNAELEKITISTDEMTKSIFFLETQINELKLKYQGVNFEIVENYIAVWDVQLLLESVKNRNNGMLMIVENEIKKLNKKNQKAIRIILLSIGLVEVLEAVIEMIDLGHAPFFIKSPEGYGIVTILSQLNPNYLLSILLLAIVMFAYIGISNGVMGKE